MITSIQNLMEIDFDSKELEERKVLLEQHYNNRKNAERIMQVIREKSQ